MFHLQDNFRTWIFFALVMAIVSGVMYGSTPDLLQDTDDGDYFAEAEIAAQDLSHLFSPHRRPSAMGRPVIDVVFLVDYWLWETRLDFYHYQVVVAHFIASLLLAFVVCRLGVSLEISFLGALLFLVHVAHFRAVHWIASIGYPLSLIFALVTVSFFVKALQKEQVLWFLSAALGLCLAILTHPASASVFLFCVYVAWHHTQSVSKTARVIWPLILSAVCCVALSYYVYPKAAQAEAVDTPLEIGRVVESFLWYLSRLITAPHWVLVQFRDEPEMWELVVGALGYGILFWVWLRNKYGMALWVVWVVVSILPFYNAGPGFRWTPAGPSRHLYFASAGTSVLFASCLFWIAHYVSARWGEARSRMGLGCVIAILVGLSVYHDWRAQSISFYASGRGYVARGDIETGIAQFKRGIERDPVWVSPDTYVRLGQMLLSINESPLKWLQVGLAQHPEKAGLIFLEGFWESLQIQDLERVARGQNLMLQALEGAKNKEQTRFYASAAYYNRGIYFYNQKEFENALPFFEEALVLNDKHFHAAYHIGQALWILERSQEAIEAYQRAIEIEPNHVEPYINIAKIFLQNERFDAVKQMCQLVLDFAPDEAEAYELLGVACHAQGELVAAQQAFEKALVLNPNQIASLLGLAVLYTTEQSELARQYYTRVLAIDAQNKYAQDGLQQLSP